jgi:hypothetical protein
MAGPDVGSLDRACVGTQQKKNTGATPLSAMSH